MVSAFAAPDRATLAARAANVVLMKWGKGVSGFSFGGQGRAGV
jgi:hypothetical protein